MNEDRCDIHDVSRAASDLVALGCSIGAVQFYDSYRQLRFSEIVSAYANQVIQAVEEGIISAKTGLSALLNEHVELSEKSLFYMQNGIGIAAGMMQIQTGAVTTANSRGLRAIRGVAYYAHGINNVYEGTLNIYYGPDKDSAVGPTRKLYQAAFKDEGNRYYYSMDIGLSLFGVFRNVRKAESVELFTPDPLNYEFSFKQMSKLALVLEALADAFTIKNLSEENEVNRPLN